LKNFRWGYSIKWIKGLLEAQKSLLEAQRIVGTRVGRGNTMGRGVGCRGVIWKK
jgi:hypothetical protein